MLVGPAQRGDGLILPVPVLAVDPVALQVGFRVWRPGQAGGAFGPVHALQCQSGRGLRRSQVERHPFDYLRQGRYPVPVVYCRGRKVVTLAVYQTAVGVLRFRDQGSPYAGRGPVGSRLT